MGMAETLLRGPVPALAVARAAGPVPVASATPVAPVAGRTLAMEISIDDGVPYLDRVPYGVVRLLESFGATIVSSGPLVTRFAARWSPAALAGHRRAAEALAGPYQR